MSSSSQPKKKRAPKTSSGKKIGNRTLIGIVCIVIAFAVCFGVTPLLNQATDPQVEVIQIKQSVTKGKVITEADVEFVKIDEGVLPNSVLTKKEDVVGKYATGNLCVGDFLYPEKVTSNMRTTDDILSSMDKEQKAISLTIESFAQGVSGKLESGDVISIIVYSKDVAEDDSPIFTPPELRYVEVVTTTTATGVDKADVMDNKQPATITVLVNEKQASLIALYEQTASMHITLECRGGTKLAKQYLAAQADYFEGRS